MAFICRVALEHQIHHRTLNLSGNFKCRTQRKQARGIIIFQIKYLINRREIYTMDSLVNPGAVRWSEYYSRQEDTTALLFISIALQEAL